MTLLGSTFLSKNLTTVFSETVTSLKSVGTLPVTTVEWERCFFTLNWIKTFLENAMGQDRLITLAVLSTARHTVTSVPDFNQKAIDVFSRTKNIRSSTICKMLG